MTKKRKALKVLWVDSSAPDGWQYKDYKRSDNLVCESIGYFVHEDKESLTIASCFSAYGAPRAPITIPKVAITSRKAVRP